MKKIMIIVGALVMINLHGVAQLQLGQGINPLFNKAPQIHNMALMSMNAVPTATLLAGSRLDGFDNHPKQITCLASGFLTDNVGVGLKVNSESAGLSTNNEAELSFNFLARLNEKGDKLSFNLGATYAQNRFRRDDAIVLDPNDPGLSNISELQPTGNASASIAFLRENKFYAGLSSYQLIKNKNAFMSSVLKNPTQRTFYFVGAYTFEIDQRFSLEFSGAAVYASSKAYAYDVGADVKFNKMFWGGIGYRSAGELKFNLGVTAQSWSFGYMCTYGSWVDAKAYTYKALGNHLIVRKLFNEGRSNK